MPSTIEPFGSSMPGGGVAGVDPSKDGKGPAPDGRQSFTQSIMNALRVWGNRRGSMVPTGTAANFSRPTPPAGSTPPPPATDLSGKVLNNAPPSLDDPDESDRRQQLAQAATGILPEQTPREPWQGTEPGQWVAGGPAGPPKPPPPPPPVQEPGAAGSSKEGNKDVLARMQIPTKKSTGMIG